MISVETEKLLQDAFAVLGMLALGQADTALALIGAKDHPVFRQASALLRAGDRAEAVAAVTQLGYRTLARERAA